uniref:Uncharacterized protein n=1 Tax=Arion vulgaris TaxID=1028688 RepID=A0A0B7AER5_9EUPU
MIRVPMGKFGHNYDAEIQAFKVAIEKLLNTSFDPQPQPVVFFDRYKINTPST